MSLWIISVFYDKCNHSCLRKFLLARFNMLFVFGIIKNGALVSSYHKQPPKVVFKKASSKNFCNIYRKTPVFEPFQGSTNHFTQVENTEIPGNMQKIRGKYVRTWKIGGLTKIFYDQCVILRMKFQYSVRHAFHLVLDIYYVLIKTCRKVSLTR